METETKIPTNNKYWLLTIKSHEGWINTFVEKGNSIYDAFHNKVKTSQDKVGYYYSIYNSIIFAHEATETDYEIYVENLK